MSIKLKVLNMLKTLGQRLRELRKEKKLSLKQVGEALGGFSAAYISDMELGNRHPSEETLVNLADILGTSVEELRSYDISRPPTREMQQLMQSNPEYGFAFRRVVETVQKENLNPEDVIRRITGKK